MASEKPIPATAELYFASLVATALVYLVGIAVIAALIALTSEANGYAGAFQFLAFFATLGVFFALIAGFLIVAPLGTAIGTLMLRFTPPGWWQGPVTGVLVALSLVALTLAFFGVRSEPLDMGTYATGAIPVVLAAFAGSFVQHRILRWPRARPRAGTNC